ncbi:MAG TPA: hypothetical protein VL026_00915 [Rhizomicrobium sp.]|nr:hypothetical protein [Rhizomicrobium sp.]
MPSQADFAPGVFEAWARKRTCELKPEDIDQTWMDLMVKRLFRELDRQLNQIEKVDTPPDAAARALNARALATMERSLGRLTRIEKERSASRDTKIATPKDDKRAQLERRLARPAQAAIPAMPEPMVPVKAPRAAARCEPARLAASAAASSSSPTHPRPNCLRPRAASAA